jgi:hypothetical protein
VYFGVEKAIAYFLVGGAIAFLMGQLEVVRL